MDGEIERELLLITPKTLEKGVELADQWVGRRSRWALRDPCTQEPWVRDTQTGERDGD